MLLYVQGVCRRPVFVPLVVKPHACDAAVLLANASGQVDLNAGAAVPRLHSPVGYNPACSSGEAEDEGPSSAVAHEFCSVEEVLSAYSLYGMLNNVSMSCSVHSRLNCSPMRVL